jgi:hypothetical protein
MPTLEAKSGGVPMTTAPPTAQEMIERNAGIGSDGHPPKSNDEIQKLLQKRRFDPTKAPPPFRAIYTLNGHAVATPANLATINSQIKTGKSAVVGALISSTMTQDPDADTLGFSSSNPKNLALCHFDTEQAPDDFWHHINRALRRARVETSPKWLYPYCLTGLGCKRAWECFEEGVKIGAEPCGGTHSILIDGVADLVADVNDAAECNDFVARLHEMAIQFDCPIWAVIHFNPGSDKSRGHLGSQLERKAETNLRLDKVNESTTIWSEKQRRAPIPKGNGPCFRWSEEEQMHVSVESVQSAADKEKRESLAMLTDELFRKRRAMTYTDLVKLLTAKKGLAVSDRTAARRISELSKLKLIEKSVVGLWIKGQS